MHALKRALAYLEVGNTRVPKKPHFNSIKNGTEKNFASQWFSATSPNSMISFKIYVKTPFFIPKGVGLLSAKLYVDAPAGPRIFYSLY